MNLINLINRWNTNLSWRVNNIEELNIKILLFTNKLSWIRLVLNRSQSADKYDFHLSFFIWWVQFKSKKLGDIFFKKSVRKILFPSLYLWYSRTFAKVGYSMMGAHAYCWRDILDHDLCLSLSGSERKYIRLDKGIQRDFGNKKILPKPKLLGVPSSLKLCSECNFCRLWGGGDGKVVKTKLLLRLY